jgi:uncharacterized membrane protein YphA (DoxX/SURF4 family)
MNLQGAYPKMEKLRNRFDILDRHITNWLAEYGVTILRISLGLVFFWFGILKFFPDLSPAQELAERTIETLSFGVIKSNVSVPVLAAWETLIGLGLISGRYMRATILLLLIQMLGTITPVFLFPHDVFTHIPYAPTLEGQYIFKNIVLVSAALVIGATVRGGKLIADPEIAQTARRMKEHDQL